MKVKKLTALLLAGTMAVSLVLLPIYPARKLIRLIVTE